MPAAETDPDLETIRIAISPQKPSPATDAFLSEVRAQGVDAAIEAAKNLVAQEYAYSWATRFFAASIAASTPCARTSDRKASVAGLGFCGDIAMRIVSRSGSVSAAGTLI